MGLELKHRAPSFNPFHGAAYAMSVHDLPGLPPDTGIEVAFVGRSNAGKSSALNALAGHKRLAFVSKTPGRTQLINFFTVGADRMLVDLPGYGYAAVPAKVKAHWQGVLASYVANREALKGIVLVMDARHPLKPLDWQLLDWLAPTGKRVHALLTKADKLNRSEQAATLASVRRALEERGLSASAQVFSSLKLEGRDEAIQVVANMLGFDDNVATSQEQGQ
jgi:GTP-binding protein